MGDMPKMPGIDATGPVGEAEKPELCKGCAKCFLTGLPHYYYKGQSHDPTCKPFWER